MSDRVLISIAMTTYNGERFVEKQILSILSQTYKNIELIICDDCSNDSTINIIKEFQKKDDRIKFYQNKFNLGYVKNFEKAISLCNGDYIALSDQDDIWMENKLEDLLSEIGNNDVIHSDAFLIDENDTIFSNSYSQYSKKLIYPTKTIELVLNGCITGCTCLMRRDFARQIIPFPDKLYVHDKYIGVVAFNNNKLKYINKQLIKYRQHSFNNIGAGKVENFSLVNKIFKYLVKKKNNNSDKTIKFIENQLNFTDIIINKYKTNIFIKDLNFIREFYFNILKRKKIFHTIFIYIKYIKYFEINKPFKYKILFILNSMRIIIFGNKK